MARSRWGTCCAGASGGVTSLPLLPPADYGLQRPLQAATHSVACVSAPYCFRDASEAALARMKLTNRRLEVGSVKVRP